MKKQQLSSISQTNLKAALDQWQDVRQNKRAMRKLRTNGRGKGWQSNSDNIEVGCY